MTTPASGQISIQDIVDEFGGTGQHALTEYFRDGTFVTTNNVNVPTSGEIKLTDFFSATNFTAADGIVDKGPSQTNTSGGNASAALRLRNDGVCDKGEGNVLFASLSYADNGDWGTPHPTTSVGSGFDIRFDVTSGSNPNGGDTINAWIALSSTRTWGNTVTGVGTRVTNYRVRIRSASTLTVLVDFTGNIVATSESE